MNSDRYNKFGVFLQNRFGTKPEKICIDGGFTCPNRDGTVGVGGCIFCEQPVRKEQIDGKNIRGQVERAIQNAGSEDKFIVYFQNYSGTYAEVNELKEKYDAALCDERIVALSVATRPDCITEEIVKLLEEYSERYYVYVEMGLQTANDKTAQLINRGYKTEDFIRAASLLSRYGIDVVAHLIFGLLDETDEDIRHTIDFINGQKISGVKIHSLYITKGSELYNLYVNGEYKEQEFDQYIRRLSYAITHLRKDIIIHRITGDCERGKLVAPLWNNRKKIIRNALERNLEFNNWTQGCFYQESK